MRAAIGKVGAAEILAAIGASIDAIGGDRKDEIGIARVHEDGKCFDLAQRMFPVATVCGAAKHAGESALFAGVITADTGEHTRWNHGMSSRATFFAILFRRVRPANVANLHCKLSLPCNSHEQPRTRLAAQQPDEVAAPQV